MAPPVGTAPTAKSPILPLHCNSFSSSRGTVQASRRATALQRRPQQLIRTEATTSNDISSRFGRRLRELRHSRGLTQADMARRFGIDRSFISEIECGRKAISLPMIEVIALGLEISLSELLQDL